MINCKEIFRTHHSHHFAISHKPFPNHTIEPLFKGRLWRRRLWKTIQEEKILVAIRTQTYTNTPKLILLNSSINLSSQRLYNISFFSMMLNLFNQAKILSYLEGRKIYTCIHTATGWKWYVIPICSDSKYAQRTWIFSFHSQYKSWLSLVVV